MNNMKIRKQYKYKMFGFSKVCKYPGCTNKARVRGYCINHYQSLKVWKKEEAVVVL